ncbi:MAG: hypothetical protein WKG01_33720 [Kofleriaceae bacterium]
MSSSLIPKLSPVAIEYLRHHDELEAARELFFGERAKLLDDLGVIMSGAAEPKGLKVVNGRRNDVTGSYVVDIDGEYVAIRAKHGTRRSSGYSAAIGSFLGYAGAQCLLWFHLRVTPSRKKRFELPALEKALGSGIQILNEGAWLYIRTASITAANADLETLEGEIRKLPDLFAIADPWLAQRFEDTGPPTGAVGSGPVTSSAV